MPYSMRIGDVLISVVRWLHSRLWSDWVGNIASEFS